jgi:hypothetical protein
VGPRNSKGAIDYESALLREDPRNVASNLKDIWKAPERSECDTQRIVDADRFLEKIDSTTVLRVGFHRMHDSTLPSSLASHVGGLLRILRCKCREAAPPSRNPRSDLLRLAALLSTADDSVLFVAHARAIKAAAACSGTLGTDGWHIDTPEEFLSRSRLQAIAELTRRYGRSKAIDINTTLRTLNRAYDVILSGRAPALLAAPTGWQVLWTPFSEAREQFSAAAASPFTKLLVDDFTHAKQAYAEGQSALLAMRKHEP